MQDHKRGRNKRDARPNKTKKNGDGVQGACDTRHVEFLLTS